MKEKALESGLFFSERERKMNYTENEIKAVFDKLEEASSIVIFGHKNPDGDCVGSVLGRKYALLSLFPNKKVYALGTHPAYLGPVDDSDIVSDETIKSSLCVRIDLSDFDRVEDQRILLSHDVVCIDHHISDKPFPYPIIRDALAPSATYVLAKSLLVRYGKIPSTKSATYLFMGLVTDSGRFQYDAEPSTFELAAKLVSYGVDYKTLYNNRYQQNSRDLRYRSFIYSHFDFSGRVSYCVVKKEDYHALNRTQEEASGKVNLLALLDHHPIWALFTEQENSTVRVELRSNGFYNVQLAAVQFNGGGHLAASGCTLSSLDIIPQVLEALNQLEEIHGK